MLRDLGVLGLDEVNGDLAAIHQKYLNENLSEGNFRALMSAHALVDCAY
jgi:hypothetical protein